jgi:hypothetical protein
MCQRKYQKEATKEDYVLEIRKFYTSIVYLQTQNITNIVKNFEQKFKVLGKKLERCNSIKNSI